MSSDSVSSSSKSSLSSTSTASTPISTACCSHAPRQPNTISTTTNAFTKTFAAVIKNPDLLNAINCHYPHLQELSLPYSQARPCNIATSISYQFIRALVLKNQSVVTVDRLGAAENPAIIAFTQGGLLGSKPVVGQGIVCGVRELQRSVILYSSSTRLDPNDEIYSTIADCSNEHVMWFINLLQCDPRLGQTHSKSWASLSSSADVDPVTISNPLTISNTVFGYEYPSIAESIRALPSLPRVSYLCAPIERAADAPIAIAAPIRAAIEHQLIETVTCLTKASSPTIIPTIISYLGSW